MNYSQWDVERRQQRKQCRFAPESDLNRRNSSEPRYIDHQLVDWCCSREYREDRSVRYFMIRQEDKTAAFSNLQVISEIVFCSWKPGQKTTGLQLLTHCHDDPNKMPSHHLSVKSSYKSNVSFSKHWTYSAESVTESLFSLSLCQRSWIYFPYQSDNKLRGRKELSEWRTTYIKDEEGAEMDSNKSFECGDLMVLLSRDDGRGGAIGKGRKDKER